MPEDTRRGLIVRAQSGFFTVQTDEGQVVCQLRGRLKRGPRTGDLAAVGDRVRITVLPDGSGVIEEIEERERAIVRLDPRPQGIYRQILLANPDQAVFVFACAHPSPRLRMLDRFLVIAEKQGIPPLIVANKVDLVSPQEAKALFGRYEEIGYPVLYTSAEKRIGIDELREHLTGKLNALAGPSGAGKSSLLNA
ncbi:MAG: ribosome small subunit-dependent GTPase A, partial [Anaerolineae bacterium]